MLSSSIQLAVVVFAPLLSILEPFCVLPDENSHLGDAAEASSEERFIEYLKVLFTDMAVMHSMLVELDPAFVLCHDYDTLGDVSQASAIASFISPNENMAQLMKLSLLDSVEERNTAGKSIVPFEGVRVIVDRMQSKLDTFESAYCRN